MKSNKIKFIPHIALIVFFTLTGFSAFAHFGSKGPYGGSVSCGLAYDSLVYIGTFNGGVYRSTNSSLVAWTPIPVGLKSGKISALAHSGSYLFAATLDSGIYIFNGFVGTDRYWNKINSGLSNLKIKSLIALDSITLLAGTDGGGLFKTINKGSNWVPINHADLNNQTVTSLIKAGNRILLSTLKGGVFVSTDQGINWSSFNDLNTAGIDSTQSLSYNASTDELAVINKNGIYISSAVSTTNNPVYILSNSGLPSILNVRSISNNGNSWYIATDNGVFNTIASLIRWESVNSGLPTNQSTVIIPFRSNLVAGTLKDGVFKSADNMISWKEMNTNFNNRETYAMETSGITVVVVATDNGVYASRDLASSYQRANVGLTDSLNVTYLKFVGTTLFAGTKKEGVFMSADTGRTWTPYNTGLPSLNIKKLFASTTSTTLYALTSSDSLFVNAGSGWSSLQSGLPSRTTITSMAFYGNAIYLGTFGQGVFVTTNQESNWASTNPGLANLNVTSLVASATRIFAGTDGSGVFVSDVSPINWQQTAPVSISHTTLMGLDGNRIQEMGYYANYIFASYKGGLLATADNGKTWIAGGNQFNLPSYTNVHAITFVTTRVFVSTDNNAVYSNALSELPVVLGIHDIDHSVSNAIAISPNPNQGNFTLQLNGLKTDIRGVAIFDNIGRLMSDFTYAKGEKSISIHTAHPPGIYFIQIRTKQGIGIKKMVIN